MVVTILTLVKDGVDPASWKGATSCRADASLQGLLPGCDHRGYGIWEGIGIHSRYIQHWEGLLLICIAPES